MHLFELVPKPAVALPAPLGTVAQGGPTSDPQAFLRDPALTVACVLLIVVSVGWIVISRLIVREMRRAAVRAHRDPDVVKPSRDIWSLPP